MILTVTLNPLLERRLIFSRINFENENRNGKRELKAGGKGINVSRQLNYLNTDNFAFTFSGGSNGKILKNVLNNEGIKFSSVRTKEETREAFIAVDESKKKVSTFFGLNSKIKAQEAEEFKNRLEKMIENCEIVVFAGSSPSEETNSIIPYGIELANKYDKISICDTYGIHLVNCIESSPTILHNNVPELEKSLNISLREEKDKLEFLDYLYGKNIKQSFLTDGERNTYASNFEFHYKVENPVIEIYDSTGSGDCFVAGVAYSWHNNLTFEECLSYASSLGICNAKKYDVCNVKPAEAEEVRLLIKITSTGKKMKTIDVTPQ
jgi:1-phosphofructokinase family hexose kinase